jgi:predicted MFS family arabinose efflux permease
MAEVTPTAGLPPSTIIDRKAMVGLMTLASAAFVYVTAETLPVGLLPQMAAGLHVRDGAIGLLVTIYAAVAGLTAIPLTALTSQRSRRQVVVSAASILALSQLVMAVSPNYGMLLGARVVCAFAHGVFWSVVAPVAARLVAPERTGHAIAIAFTGNSLALVLGTPLTTGLGDLLGWRAATALVGIVAALSALAMWIALPLLPSEVLTGTVRSRLAAIPSALRSRSLIAVSVVTALLVVGHFTAYTYISNLARSDAGLTGLGIAAVLLAYGIAGVGGLGLIGWVSDLRPRLAAAMCAIGLTLALAGLLAIGHGSAGFTIGSIVVWGAAFTALPVCLQSAVLHVAPRSADTASALYVVAFQIGIGGGALVGSVLVDDGRLAELPLVGMVFAAAGTAVLLAARRAFPRRAEAAGAPCREDDDHPVTSSEPSLTATSTHPSEALL